MTNPNIDTPALLAQIEENLQQLLTLLPQLLEQGITPHVIKNMEDADSEQLYKKAYDLFEAEAYQDALPIFLHLIAHHLHDPRFPFAAAMCFQQMQEPFNAALLYGHALLLNPDDAASAFRMGECLAALEQPEQAAQTFEMTLELIEANFESYQHLQQPTEARLRQLRS